MHVYLETERLILRQFTEADVDDLFALHNDPEVMHFLNGGRPTPREEIERETLPRYLSFYTRDDGYGLWATVEKSSGEFLGWFHLIPAKGGPPDEPELGYRLQRSAWGKGYGTEGSRALIHKAFTELGARLVRADTMVVHTGSRRVMEKSGLKLVRTFHQEWPDKIEGDEHGDVEYALTRGEWTQRRPAESTT
jgi:RimJ/RimL family protein N-acetyltransferase